MLRFTHSFNHLFEFLGTPFADDRWLLLPITGSYVNKYLR